MVIQEDMLKQEEKGGWPVGERDKADKTFTSDQKKKQVGKTICFFMFKLVDSAIILVYII